MAIILITSFLLLGTAYGDLPVINRQANDTSYTCTDWCFGEFFKKPLMPYEKTMKEFIDLAIHPCNQDLTSLDMLCIPYDDTKKCIQACPKGPAKDQITVLLQPVRYICSDRRNDYQQSLACINMMCEKVREACFKCENGSNYESSFSSLIRNQFLNLNSNQTVAPGAIVWANISEACTFGNCYNTCSSPLMQQCTNSTYVSNLDQNMLREMIVSAANRFFKVNSLPSMLVPASCKELGHNAAAVFGVSIWCLLGFTLILLIDRW